ncbi:MAG: hypothetical protein ACK5Z5_00175 [Neisseriaceae bacterium]
MIADARTANHENTHDAANESEYTEPRIQSEEAIAMSQKEIELDSNINLVSS